MSNNQETQDKDVHLTTAIKMPELDDSELETIAGGVPILAPAGLAVALYGAFTTPEERKQHRRYISDKARAVGRTVSKVFA